MDHVERVGDRCGMIRFSMAVDDASALLTTATPGEVAETTSVEQVSSWLEDVDQALRALSRGTQRAADGLIPPGAIDESPARRYARAAATRVRIDDGPAPSYERQAQILTALHDAGATLRAAAECCRRARQILDSTIA
jgi:hypothetical protein